MKSDSLRVLHLEDEPIDRELVQRALSNAGLDCRFTSVSNKDDYALALKEQQYDLVLADWTIPGYGGLFALEDAQKRFPEIPFIFVSGSIGEDQAVESLKRGATDYILKDRMDRLPMAIKRALQGIEEKRQRTELESKFRSLFDNAVEGIFQSTPDGRFVTANPALARMLGYSSPEELMASIDNAVGPLYVDLAQWNEFRERLATHGKVEAFELQVRRKDGRQIWISENVRAIRDETGNVRYHEGSIEDITVRREAVEALRHSEARFREMAESIRDVFWVTSPDWHQILYVSSAYELIWGRPASDLNTRPMSWLEAVVPEDREKTTAALDELAKGISNRMEYRIRRPDLTERWIETRGFPVFDENRNVVRLIGVTADITERKNLENHLLQAQKMEVVGLLSSGIAHDFNNILTVIFGYVNLLLDNEPLSPKTTHALKIVYTASERAAGLIRQLLVFSRKRVLKHEIINLGDAIEETAKMLYRLLGEPVSLEVELSSQPTFISADVGMIEQVLMNLAVNARDAMPKGGKLSIKTEVKQFDTIQVPSHLHARVGSFVCISVRDTGGGIPPEIISRIFEPFFTTKEVGRGTGLGLATVRDIVNLHNGWIDLQSEINVGTTFFIFLPLVPPETVPAQTPHIAYDAMGKRETILLVEDEIYVREFAVAVLQQHNYSVLQARSGDHALEVWQRHAHKIDLLLTDVVMPGDTSGLDLAEKLQAKKPSLKVILVSGYTNETSERVFVHGENSKFLHKPYLPAGLARAVRDILDQRNGLASKSDTRAKLDFSGPT
ncbi:MAG TPA: response regulator [Opitutaceae bacterium]|nr:response regulator [Opitutaceae bacterium]